MNDKSFRSDIWSRPKGGNIFFYDLSEPDFATAFTLMQNVGHHFLPAYMPILERRKDTPFGERECDSQLYRRYVEFNLVIDRGTIFGLQTNGRIYPDVHAKWIHSVFEISVQSDKSYE